MPRYHFDIIEGGSTYRDDEGEICRDHRAVETEAINTATDVIRHGPVEPDGVARTVEVRNHAGQQVLRVLVGEIIEVRRLIDGSCHDHPLSKRDY